MNTYIAFLRGINVSGQKKIKMADLKESMIGAGLKNVVTYIQSGNVIFDSLLSEVNQIEHIINVAIKNDFDFDVPVVVKTPSEIQQILNDNPFKAESNTKGLYFTLLHQTPSAGMVMEFQQLKFKNEDFHYADNCVYMNCKMGAGKAKLSNNLIENKLKVGATTRNLNTMLKMIQLTQ